MEIKGVSIFARKGNKFLAVKRSKDDKIFGGMWALPGGKIEENESVREAAKREVSEETGFNLTSMDDIPCMEGMLNIKGYPSLLIFIYKGEVSDEVPRPRDKDIEKVEWVDRVNFMNSLRDNNYPKEGIEKLENFFDAEGLK
jgi:8-oxo-dGTP diphosphatase